MTDLLVLLQFMRLAGMDTLDGQPPNLPDSPEERLHWLKNLSEAVVDSCWMPPSSEDVRCVSVTMQDPEGTTLADSDPFPFCDCRNSKCQLIQHNIYVYTSVGLLWKYVM